MNFKVTSLFLIVLFASAQVSKQSVQTCVKFTDDYRAMVLPFAKQEEAGSITDYSVLKPLHDTLRNPNKNPCGFISEADLVQGLIKYDGATGKCLDDRVLLCRLYKKWGHQLNFTTENGRSFIRAFVQDNKQFDADCASAKIQTE